MKLFITILLICAGFIITNAQNNLLRDLKSAIDSSNVYDTQKRKEIFVVKKQLNQLKESNYEHRFDLNQQLFDQYKVFKKRFCILL